MKYHWNIKCDCGHRQKDHSNKNGHCSKDNQYTPGIACECTKFLPNSEYRKKILKEKMGNKSAIFIAGNGYC